MQQKDQRISRITLEFISYARDNDYRECEIVECFCFTKIPFAILHSDDELCYFVFVGNTKNTFLYLKY